MTCPPGFRSWLPLAASLVLIAPSIAGAQGIEQPRIPLKTALSEIRTFREAYADAYNKKDSATVMDMYAPEAIMLGADGSVLSGKDAIGKSLGDTQSWSQLTITSDTLRVVGHTAWDIGTTKSEEPGGAEHVSHYLVVLRRGLKEWKINSLALVPEAPAPTAVPAPAAPQ